jgi:methylenetetrahydrofolate dehydrogenase (NADP+) / methenyltetrahydrofolate cyclohydrolase
MKSLRILNGKEVAEAVDNRLQKQSDFLNSKGIQPKLTVVIVGDDPASHVYVRRKGKACEKLSIISDTIHLAADTSEDSLLELIDRLNKDAKNNGILVQLPLPDQINENKVIRSINPQKDVDCFHPQNVGLLVAGQPYVLPCTPAGILEILKYYNISTSGKNVVVMGRSNIVGKPMANLLLQKNKYANATVTIVHSRTADIAAHTRHADILIAAIGQAHFVKADMCKEDAVVIDVGMNRIDAQNEKGYELVGDVHFETVSGIASAITPVPGGVGPMTIAMLMQNTLTVTAEQNGLALPYDE